jgi:hypothetical protein
MEPIKLSLSREEIPIEIDDIEYKLVTPSSKDIAFYRTEIMKQAVRRKDGSTVMKGSSDHESLLVSLCMLDSEDKNVSPKTVGSWPAPIVKVLFAKCGELAGFEEDDDEDDTDEAELGN